MRNERDRFGVARREAILDELTVTGGKASNKDLDQAARKAELAAIEKVGIESESRFDSFSARFRTISSVRPPTPEEDTYRKIDRWVTFKEELSLPEWPVQIKSSYRDARLFKFGDPNTNKKPDPGFISLHGLIIVINCGPSVKYKSFRRQAYQEITRIKSILDTNPSFIKLIEKISTLSKSAKN